MSLQSIEEGRCFVLAISDDLDDRLNVAFHGVSHLEVKHVVVGYREPHVLRGIGVGVLGVSLGGHVLGELLPRLVLGIEIHCRSPTRRVANLNCARERRREEGATSYKSSGVVIEISSPVQNVLVKISPHLHNQSRPRCVQNTDMTLFIPLISPLIVLHKFTYSVVGSNPTQASSSSFLRAVLGVVDLFVLPCLAFLPRYQVVETYVRTLIHT